MRSDCPFDLLSSSNDNVTPVQFLSIQEVRSIPEHKVWGADRHWRKPPSVRLTPFQFRSCMSRIRCRYRGEWVSAGVASLVVLLEASGHNIFRRTTSKITGTTTQKSDVVFVGIPFVQVLWVLKTSVPVSPQNFFPGRRMSRKFSRHKNAVCLAMPTNSLTFPQWEKTYTGVGRQSSSR